MQAEPSARRRVNPDTNCALTREEAETVRHELAQISAQINGLSHTLGLASDELRADPLHDQSDVGRVYEELHEASHHIYRASQALRLEPQGGVAGLMVAVGDVWRDKETSHLIVVVPSIEGIATVAFGAPSGSPETHWTPHDFLRTCQRVPDDERL